MGNLINTYQLIADILSFKSDDSVLKYNLQNNKQANWDSLVKVGSSHLVLPAIYCSLKERRLLDQLPDDLNQYLLEITSINKNRNLGLINEAKSISELLTKHKIKHVFFSGCRLVWFCKILGKELFFKMYNIQSHTKLDANSISIISV